MSFFSKVFKPRGATKKNAQTPTNGHVLPSKPQWSDAWVRTRVDPEEVAELLRGCTIELKSRALDTPLLLLPFRPTSDQSAARTFIRNFFVPPADQGYLRGQYLQHELRLTEPMVLASILKWCWSRLPGGIVTWEAYEMFKLGERDSNFDRDAFSTFLPISVESKARLQIIFDFFDLMAGIAAHWKTNGFGGRKLSRYAGWWAFDHYDSGKGFDAGYRSWASAANASSHLFFAYLRSLSPDSNRGANGILGLPLSLQQLVQATEYPPETPSLMAIGTTKVVMIVDTVSPTPYALLRRAKNFEYRHDDSALQQFASYNDPVQSLTEECRRVLRCISSSNQSTMSPSKASGGLRDASWSRFEDVGFAGATDESDVDSEALRSPNRTSAQGWGSSIRSGNVGGARPTTPSWADFMSSGFADEDGSRSPTTLLLPPDKVLPSIDSMSRGRSSHSHQKDSETESTLDAGELASITHLDVDDSFWWVWISSLAGEEPTSRKAAFGRCALIETVLTGGKWMIMEEQVKGAAPEPVLGSYIAERKTFLGFTTKRGRPGGRKASSKKSPLSPEPSQKIEGDPSVRATLGPDQQARIQAAAAELQRKNKEEEQFSKGIRRGRFEESQNTKTNSVMTLQPILISEASSALKWANQYDKQALRAQYLGEQLAGKGVSQEMLTLPTNGLSNRSISSMSSTLQERALPATPKADPPTLSRVISPAPLPMTPSTASNLAEVKDAARVPLPPPQQADEATSANSALPAPPRNLPVAKSASRETKEAAQSSLPTSSHDDKENAPPMHTAKSETPRHTLLSKQSLDHNPTDRNSRRTGTPGLKGMFVSKRYKSSTVMPNAKPGNKSGARPRPPPVETVPAIAAARAALEGKSKPGNRDVVLGFDSKIGRMAGAQSKAAVATVTTVPEVIEEQPESSPVPQQKAKQVFQEPVPSEKPQRDERSGTHRDEEYDQLSRVPTLDREHADEEFSTFDQGPLPEHPALVPGGFPQSPEAVTPAETPSELPENNPPPPQQSIHSAVTMQSPEPESDYLTRQSSPGDRWAQIRKNAAERARLNEEQNRPALSETKSDDGETSGEETIESRVARIKARVAELTGNMESARH